jgi:hypothetical protein
MNLIGTIKIFGGGVGSGCNPAAGHCGRPKVRKSAEVIQKRADLKKELDTVRQQLRHKRGTALYVKKAQRARLKIIREGLKSKLRYYGRKDRLMPGMKRVGKLHTIPVQDAPKSKVKTSYVAQGGYKVTTLTGPKEYEKSGQTWLKKNSPFKGQFTVDVPEHHTVDDPKEKNTFFRAQVNDDKAISVEVHRNIGQLGVQVVERQLGQYDAIVSHREVAFKNLGTAHGFLAKRYGITFKLK